MNIIFTEVLGVGSIQYWLSGHSKTPHPHKHQLFTAWPLWESYDIIHHVQDSDRKPADELLERQKIVNL